MGYTKYRPNPIQLWKCTQNIYKHNIFRKFLTHFLFAYGLQAHEEILTSNKITLLKINYN